MPKNAKKTEENIKAAQERLARLQEQQRKFNELRKQGYLGSDLAITRALEEEKRKKEQQAAQEQRRKDEQAARAFVEEVLQGPHGNKVERFLGKNSPGDAIKLAEIIRNYLKTQGLDFP